MVVIKLEDVKERLIALNVDLTPTDDTLLNFNIDKVTNFIKNETNQSQVPQGAYEIAIDMVIYEFLFIKNATGTLDIPGMDLNASAVKSIKDGDTTIDYGENKGASNDPVSRFYMLLANLAHKEQDWGIWRRIRW